MPSVLHDISREWPDLQGPLIGAALTCAAVLVARSPGFTAVVWRVMPIPERHRRALYRGVAWCGLLFTLTVAGLVLVPWVQARRALASGQARTVEGPVTGFTPALGKGASVERFSVGGATFLYQDHVATTGYHRTRQEGGVIEDGLRLRVRYLEQPGPKPPVILVIERLDGG
jgi:hypothetical protein